MCRKLILLITVLVYHRRRRGKKASMNYLAEVDNRVLDTGKPMRSEAFVFPSRFSAEFGAVTAVTHVSSLQAWRCGNCHMRVHEKVRLSVCVSERASGGGMRDDDC